MALPSGYKVIDRLASIYSSSSSTNAYFDTGLYPKDTYRIESLFAKVGSLGETHFFGARNTSSNTSAGQISFGLTSNDYPYIAYNNKTTTILSDASSKVFYGIEGLNLYVLDSTEYANSEGTSGTFTGTRTMYILARNNAGSVQYGAGLGYRCIFNLKIWDNDTLIAHYVPAYEEASSTYGLYEMVSSTFLTKTGGTNGFGSSVSFTVSSSGNGNAYISDERVGDVSEILISSAIGLLTPSPIRIRAVANDGYVFLNWTNNGTIVSTDDDFYIDGVDYNSSSTNLVANFVKKTKIGQYNGFRAMAFQYGANAEGENDQRSNVFAEVISASIKEDILSRTTSTIELDSAEGISNNSPIVITDSMNKKVYIGLINGIDNNTLEVREPLAITDTEFLLNSSFLNGKGTVPVVLANFGWRVVNGQMAWSNTSTNPAMLKKGSPFRFDIERMVHSDGALNIFSNVPTDSNVEVINVEDYILELSNQYMIYVDPKYVPDRENYGDTVWTGQGIVMEMVNPLELSALVIGDNSEEISNISIQVEEAENTVLEIHNAAGTSLKGIYGVKDDGTIAQMQYTSSFPDDLIGFMARYNCKSKVVNSDDPINTLIKQYLSNSFFNHIITFDVDLTKNTFNFDDFKLCRPIRFYYGNKLYNSVVTAREYNINANESTIKTMKVTLGKVRTSLTSKLKLKR